MEDLRPVPLAWDLAPHLRTLRWQGSQQPPATLLRPSFPGQVSLGHSHALLLLYGLWLPFML